MTLASAVMMLSYITGAWGAATETILHRFPIPGSDGKYPTAPLIADSAGNLYGTTNFGGSLVNGGVSGTVFKLSRASNGSWSETVLHSFSGGTDGGYPYSSLVLDSQGALYGTTYDGGDTTYCNGGCGVVFKLTPNSDGIWTESVLHTFTSIDGQYPLGPLTFDQQGNLYGTTSDGGLAGTQCWNGCGVVFQLTPSSGGNWTYHQIYNFTGGSDAGNPSSQLVFGKDGSLYGAAGWAVVFPEVVFKLTPASATWTLTVLHTFPGCITCDTFGVMPGVTFDAIGNLYGAVPVTGKYASGFVYRLTPSGGTWMFKDIHDFTNQADGGIPFGNLVVAKHGILYGATYGGGDRIDCFNDGCGVVYELMPASGGTWSEKTLYGFRGGKDGNSPHAGLLMDSAGNLYGTTYYGSSTDPNNPGYGVVFKIMP
jgi:hypothetical protein